MKMYRPIYSKCVLLLIAILSITACSVQKTGSPAEFEALTNKVVNGDTLRIEMDAAYPLNTYASQQVIQQLMRNTGNTANRIDLSGDSYFLEIHPDMVKASLPFFGERRQGAGYNNPQDSGINFEQAPEDYLYTADNEAYKYEIEFDANDKTENYDVDVVVFANGKATVYVRSTTRTVMQYQGRVVPTNDSKK
ncbi:DUF4251 domain-containing protein [Nonlabens sp. YIK11]|uniref:DUF4251 domain-containing protein n=1 Tax=Nonlabens sp. YIK11 TaxID=1453349 RepID=UPI0009E7B36B|nr:DUF4251 domain-containing protein [Nonlabens sp. YIK11]